MVYLDNAATSWPKPETVYRAVDQAMREKGGNPGRSGHRSSLAAGKVIEGTRSALAQLFAVPEPAQIVFCLNATDALNLALKGLLQAGDHVVTSTMEHNSLTRPLEHLKAIGITYTKLKPDPVDGLSSAQIRSALTARTKLVALSHLSNVTGMENPIAEIGESCREAGVHFLVDAAQSAGTVPIDVESMQVDLLAFPGHKGLFGPQGTGGLYIRKAVRLGSIREGGTGSYSEMPHQPESMPDKFESGTQNTPGLAGLGAGVAFVATETPAAIQKREAALANRLIDGLSQIKGVKLYGPPAGPTRSGVVSITLDHVDAVEAALILDSAFGIAVRAGLHCAPDAHATLRTLQCGGTIRISIGAMNTEADINCCIAAIEQIALT